MKTQLILLAVAIGALLTSCKKAEGEQAAVSEAKEVTTTTDGTTYPVNLDASTVNWEGAKPTASHTGTIALSDGEIIVNDGQVVGGEFTLDMTSITVTDLEGDMKANLENHLKGNEEGKEDHFFNVEQYPTGKYVITKATALEGDADATHLIYGNLTLRDQTKEVGFKAKVSLSDNAIQVSTPPFTIDRTDWGVNYGSKSIFDNLGDKFINDEIGLTITLAASSSAI
ncbi:MAG: YceI family protein [Bacteroidota bacterium]